MRQRAEKVFLFEEDHHLVKVSKDDLLRLRGYCLGLGMDFNRDVEKMVFVEKTITKLLGIVDDVAKELVQVKRRLTLLERPDIKQRMKRKPRSRRR